MVVVQMSKLIVPAEIPWEHLKGKELEELLYWLLDSMGAKELTWRIGGKGQGAADQGRDLELSMNVPMPDGEFRKERWWVQARGRKKTLAQSDFSEVVNNATVGRGGERVDVVVIATNSVFSNAAIDWVADWNKERDRPLVKLWGRPELERLCSQHPDAVARLFVEALTPSGKVEVIKAKLWDHGTFAGEPMLTSLWKVRHELSIDARALVALTASEAANGDLNRRSWGMLVNPSVIEESLALALLNTPVLVHRAEAAGSGSDAFISAFAYLIFLLVARAGAECTNQLLKEVWDWGCEYPPRLREAILEPVLVRLIFDVCEACAANCDRVTWSGEESDSRIASEFWYRLTDREEATQDTLLLQIERLEAPCAIGFQRNGADYCPFIQYNAESSFDNVLGILEVIERVIHVKARY
ncbi:MAG: restriction endonuclease [Planctomycetes bacterium]|nr:restriction endonuclease [Planctomycetota bacterium]